MPVCVACSKIATSIGGGAIRTRSGEADEFEATGVVERLAPYGIGDGKVTGSSDPVDDELVERAATLLRVLPVRQHRETIESLVFPHDRQRARRAVDALIESAYATEDEAGRLSRVTR